MILESLALLEDLTNLDCFSIDKDGTQLYEDAFSVERTNDGGYRIGIHVTAASRLIPFGSIAHIIARRIGRSCEVEIDGESKLVQLFPQKIRKRLGLSEEPRVTFSLSFETEQDFNILPESYNLRLAYICNTNPLCFSAVDATLQSSDHSSDRLASSLRLLERFILKYNSHGAHFRDHSARVSAADITQRMLEIFNWYADSQLRESGFAIPLKDSAVVERYQTKFSGPARSYRVLLAQHQLELFLQGKQPLYKSQVAEQLSLTGPAASESAGAYLIRDCKSLRRSDPSAKIVIKSDGSLAKRPAEHRQGD
jgi:hypothetical protein